MNTLILVRGLPGSGKSTAAEILADTGIADCFGEPTIKNPICTTDDYFMVGDKYVFDVDKLAKAHEWCMKKCEDAMDDFEDKIFVANTNATEAELEPYYEMAKRHNYRVISLIVENRHGGETIHDIPEDRMQLIKDGFTIKL